MLLPAQVHTLPDHQACWCCCSSIQHGRHFGDSVLPSLKERGDCCFYRWPEISLPNWKYCVFVPSIEISSKLTWRVLDCFWTSRKTINRSHCIAWYKSIHRPLLIHSVMNIRGISIYYYYQERRLISPWTDLISREGQVKEHSSFARKFGKEKVLLCRAPP